MWRGDVAMQRNPMELVTVKGTTIRVRKPRSLSPNDFQRLLDRFTDDCCLRMLALLGVSCGLPISEAPGIKWSDVDWLNKTIRIQRSIVKQVIGT